MFSDITLVSSLSNLLKSKFSYFKKSASYNDAKENDQQAIRRELIMSTMLISSLGHCVDHALQNIFLNKVSLESLGTQETNVARKGKRSEAKINLTGILA